MREVRAPEKSHAALTERETDVLAIAGARQIQ